MTEHLLKLVGGKYQQLTAAQTANSVDNQMSVTPDGKAIMYQDSYQGLWRQALDEEKPRQVKGFEELRVFQFTWLFDGKNLAYTTGEATREIILIENFR